MKIVNILIGAFIAGLAIALLFLPVIVLVWVFA